MRYFLFLLTALVSLGFMSPASAQMVEDHDSNDSDGNGSGLVDDGDIDIDDDFDITDNSSSSANSDVNIDDDDFYLNVNQIPGMTLNGINQMVHTNVGTANCAVEDAGGSEFRIGFPPSIVIKDQNVDGGECMDALNSLSSYTQANVLVQVTNYVNTIPGLNDNQRYLLTQELNGQVLRMFIPNYDDLMAQGRKKEITELQYKLERKIETEEDTYTKFTRILKENREHKVYVPYVEVEQEVEVKMEVETDDDKVIKGGF